MKVLDATFLVDYLDGVDATADFYDAHGGEDERWVVPAPTYAEVLVGVGNLPSGEVAAARAALGWTAVYEVDEDLAHAAAAIADEVGPDGPFLDGPVALVAAVARELDCPVVSRDSDLTHDATGAVVEVETY